MKLLMALGLMTAATSSYAFFWDNDDWECRGPFGEIPGCNPYDEWDPRYWMEEMEEMWNDDDDYGYGRGGYGMPYGAGYQQPYGYGYPQQPYGYPQPYAAPAPAPASKKKVDSSLAP